MRAANRGTIAEATDPNRLVYVSAKEGVPFRRNAIRLNYADASGKVRLFTRSRGARQLTPVENRDVIQWASEQAHPGRAQWVPPGPNQGKPVSALSSLAIEVAALARIEAGEIEDSQIDETGGLLMAGFLLTLRNSKRPNMRLADLLAGIAVRYGKEDLYLAKL